MNPDDMTPSERINSGELVLTILPRPLMIEGFKLRGVYDPEVHDNMTDAELAVSVQAIINEELGEEQGITTEDLDNVDMDEVMAYAGAIRIIAEMGEVVLPTPRTLADGDLMHPALSSLLDSIEHSVDGDEYR